MFYILCRSKYPSQAKNAHAHSLPALVRNAHAHSLRAPHTALVAFCTNALWIQFLLATSMDSECPTPNVQPTLDDGATPSAEACDQTAATAPSRASECTEARDRKLARDRARRRERLASETAEEKERRLSQRRVRDRARRAASRPSAHSEKARDRARRRERLASKQLRRRRGAYHNAEFETEDVVHPAARQHTARNASSK